MILGVDLGTTNSTIGYYNEDHWELIPNEFGEFLTPSVISLNKSGEILVGKIAKEKLTTSPKSTFYNFKRTMGSKIKYKYQKMEFSSEELSAILLNYLIRQAENHLNTKADEIIVTVPAYFDDKQRIATKNAAKLTNIKIDRLINEPSAAALAYHYQTNEDGYYMVFDFGGGTLDISIVDVFKNVIDVQAIVGDNQLGGTDIDVLIADHFKSQFEELEKLKDEPYQRLCLLAEKTKIRLSNETKCDLVFTYNDKTYRQTYDLQLLTDICCGVLIRIKELMIRIFKDARIDTIDLKGIIGIGGSSKLLFVRQYIEKITRVPFLLDIEPQEAVAIGAVIAAAIKQRKNNVKDIVLTDVCPFSLGVGTYQNAFSVIIPKNSTLPCSLTQPYTTVYDNQREVRFVVYQGEKSEADKNNKLTDFKILVPVLPKGEAQINITFSYDINGILNIEALSDTDHKNSTVVTNNLLDEKTITKKRKELDKLKNNITDNPQISYLLEKAEAIYQDAPNENKEQIADSIAIFKSIVKSGKITKVLRSIESFGLYLDKLSMFEFKVTLFTEEEDDESGENVLLN